MRIWIIILIIILILVIVGSVYLAMTYQKKLKQAQLESVIIPENDKEEKTDIMKYLKLLILL